MPQNYILVQKETEIMFQTSVPGSGSAALKVSSTSPYSCITVTLLSSVAIGSLERGSVFHPVFLLRAIITEKLFLILD